MATAIKAIRRRSRVGCFNHHSSIGVSFLGPRTSTSIPVIKKRIPKANITQEYLPDVTQLWTHLMRPALRDDDFNMEKNVIKEEIAMYEDTPSYDVIDKGRSLHFDSHPCGNSVLGTRQSIDALSAKQMHDYFTTVADRPVHSGTVADVSFDELEIFVLEATVDVTAFDLGVVKVIEVVDSNDRAAVGEKPFA